MVPKCRFAHQVIKYVFTGSYTNVDGPVMQQWKAFSRAVCSVLESLESVKNLCETSRPHLLIHVLFFQTMVHIHAELWLMISSTGTLLVSIQYYKYHAVDIISFCLLRERTKMQVCHYGTGGFDEIVFKKLKLDKNKMIASQLRL